VQIGKERKPAHRNNDSYVRDPTASKYRYYYYPSLSLSKKRELVTTLLPSLSVLSSVFGPLNYEKFIQNTRNIINLKPPLVAREN
jgi:hypothetical protein